MTQTADRYGKVLYDLRVPAEDVEQMKAALCAAPQLVKILNDPTLTKEAATLYCVHEPDENQKAQMEQFVRRTYGVNGVEMTVEQQPDLIGGFVLRVGDREFDWSLRGRVRQLQQRLIRR